MYGQGDWLCLSWLQTSSVSTGFSWGAIISIVLSKVDLMVRNVLEMTKKKKEM